MPEKAVEKALSTEEKQRRERAIAMDNEIRFGERGAQVETWAQVQRFGQWAIESGLTKLKKPAEVMVAVQMGAELGFSIMQSLQVVHVIDGKPSLSVEAQCAKVESDGALEPGTKIRHRFEGEGEGLACIAWSQPKGGEVIESEPIYLRDFKHLRGKDNWKNYPKRMMSARARGWHVRDYYPGSVRNLPLTDEVIEVREQRGESPMRDVTPPKAPDPLLAVGTEEPRELEVVDESKPEVLDPGYCPKCFARAIDFEGTDAAPTKFLCPNGHGWEPGEGAPQPAPAECQHPEGFAYSAEADARMCIHCGEVEEPEGTQESML